MTLKRGRRASSLTCIYKRMRAVRAALGKHPFPVAARSRALRVANSSSAASVSKDAIGMQRTIGAEDASIP